MKVIRMTRSFPDARTMRSKREMRKSLSTRRVDGLIVKSGDDLMAATRYAMMMRRKAKTQEEASSRRSHMAMPVVEFGVFDPVAGY